MKRFSLPALFLAAALTAGGETYTIATIAGGWLPNNVQATSVSVDARGVAVDSAGNAYLAWPAKNLILRLDAVSRLLTVVAGIGSAGYSGDGGPATEAQLNGPVAVAVDAAGSVFVADARNNVIRKITKGTITAFAGTGATYANGYGGYSGDGGPATSAQLFWPQGVAVDSSGNVYIADFGNYRVRKVSGGVITTVAGTGASDYGGDGGPATDAGITPCAVAVDANGDLYIADEASVIRKVAGGVISTFAGNGQNGYSGDNGPATSAELTAPNGVAVDANGDVYIADGAGVVRKVANGTITTLAGTGQFGYSGDGGPAVKAQLGAPTGVAVDSSGNVYIAQLNGLRKVADGIITTAAGNGTASYAGDNGPATNAELNHPAGVGVDLDGNIYIGDMEDNVIREVSNGTITTVAGNGTEGYAGDGHAAAAANLNCPTRVILDANADLYIADSTNAVIRKVTHGIITEFKGPAGVAVDGAGNLYIADYGNNCIRKVTNGIITTVAGDGTRGYSGDGGPAEVAQLSGPAAVAVDTKGNVYIADSGNHVIRMLSNGIITTIAGTGKPGFSGDNGPAVEASLNQPSDVAVDSSGNLYIADTGNNRVRMLTAGAVPTISGVVNAASFEGPITPGGFVTIYGQNFATAAAGWSSAITDGKTLPTRLEGVSVQINGKDCFVNYASPSQLNVLTPPDATIGMNAQSVSVKVTTAQGTAASSAMMTEISPAFFSYSLGGKLYPAAIFANSTEYVASVGALPGASSRPAKPGDYIELFANGLGPTLTPYPVGQVLFAAYPIANLSQVQVTIGGKAAPVLYAGMTFAGVFQINVQVPSGIADGDLPVLLTVARESSPPGTVLTFQSQ